MTDTIKITFITPCFCRGADCSESGEPEIRSASIRGQLHWWFRALGGRAEDEDIVFGNIKKENMASASKLVVRVRMTDKCTLTSPTLPHKNGGRAASKKAFAPGASFELLLSWRFGGVNPELDKKFNDALSAWLHMGALGLRATRGGGNFTWEGQPGTPDLYAERIRVLTHGTKIRVALLNGETFTDAESARRIITDTLGETAFPGGTRPLGGIQKPYGGRKTSPLRFRAVKFSDKDFRILAVWDGRDSITGNTEKDLRSAAETLETHHNPKKIGTLLKCSVLLQ